MEAITAGPGNIDATANYTVATTRRDSGTISAKECSIIGRRAEIGARLGTGGDRANVRTSSVFDHPGNNARLDQDKAAFPLEMVPDGQGRVSRRCVHPGSGLSLPRISQRARGTPTAVAEQRAGRRAHDQPISAAVARDRR